jgi:hypothetical protein
MSKAGELVSYRKIQEETNQELQASKSSKLRHDVGTKLNVFLNQDEKASEEPFGETDEF